ncbi:serine/threonine-protein kinase [Pseudactinotalea suaedae]|uniref:serine/threonine-protein kinase n=1 Tax=Pseudactinotalea suaedae TaxID=1524924 RepID=UPI0012E2F704|nr:serine/threonine-protein kinase [Pseudactinotalea suaedae]
MTACTQPGCTGTYEDGWCNVCGSPESSGGGATAASAAAATPTGGASPSAVLGAGMPEARPDSGKTSAMRGPEHRDSTRTSSARLASTAIGSARTGSRTTRRVGTGSTRLRGHRLGAGLTTVPPVPVADPLQAIMPVAEVPERKRYCASCGGPVGRSRGEVQGRSSGFCPACGAKFNFDPVLKPGELVAGQYEVVGCLAHGGLGWIYLARDRNVSGRWVVLKGLLNADDADAAAAAIAEQRFLAEVEHPLIVEIYNFVVHDDAGYTVMEYVGGKSLKDILKDRRDANHGVVDPLPVDQALAYVLEVLPAFAYLHDHNLLYCDFKPDNIIQQGEGVKLIDMGGVRRVDDDVSAIFGTVGYQAPEVAELGPSVASDIYTIGRTLATLVLDFRGNTSTYVASLPPVADTPVFGTYDSFYRLLAKACAPNPDDRFGSVDEMRVQLLGVLREVVSADRGPGNPATTSSASALFTAPTVDVPERPLMWHELPELEVDPSDPMASFLAGVNVADPVARVTALNKAPERTVEVQLAIAQAAVAANRIDVARSLIGEILADDPWEWRALWIGGLADLAGNDAATAVASFNAVYGQVPGELAPKLALATACEVSGELDVAESLYVVCARSDANYTAPSAFGLTRIRSRRQDLDGVLRSLDLVAPTRGSYPAARLQRARALTASGRGLQALDDALRSIDGVPLSPAARADLRIEVLEAALAQVHRTNAPMGAQIADVPAQERPLRDAVEAAYRERARIADTRGERIALVDRANAVRNWTLW